MLHGTNDTNRYGGLLYASATDSRVEFSTARSKIKLYNISDLSEVQGSTVATIYGEGDIWIDSYEYSNNVRKDSRIVTEEGVVYMMIKDKRYAPNYVYYVRISEEEQTDGSAVIANLSYAAQV